MGRAASTTCGSGSTGRSRRTSARLSDFNRKFYSIPYAVKDYREFDDTRDVIIRCLVNQNRMRIDYGGVWGEGHTHEFDPYTLSMYRGGLYLIGHSRHYGKNVYLAVERIRRAERLAARFEYPRDYSPAKHTEGTFGIVDGPEVEVRLELLTPETVALLSSRRLHPTQLSELGVDGRTVLSMRVRGTNELKNWILGMGEFVRVLGPEGLREEVATALLRAAGLYEVPSGLAERGRPDRDSSSGGANT